jgi:hypothetical protein
MEGLVKKGLLYVRVMGVEWIVPGDEDELVVPDGYIVSFMHFHERMLASPPTSSSVGSFTTTRLSYSI